MYVIIYKIMYLVYPSPKGVLSTSHTGYKKFNDI